MRTFAVMLFALLLACRSPQPVATPSQTQASVPPADAAPSVTTRELAADSPLTTVEGNTFIAPAGWSVMVRGPATILAPPEGDSHIALIDLRAADADAAVAAAWAAFQPDANHPVMVTSDSPDQDGWQHIRQYVYQTSPNERRLVIAVTHQAGEIWTVTLFDMAQATAEKRGGQVALILGRLLPAGYARESFAGKQANPLDADRVAELTRFVDTASKALGIPGVWFGLIQEGKVVFAGGVGVRELGGKDKVDGDTRYLIASNTKALTTLMLAKLVDQGKLTWDTPVSDLLPSFQLGDAEITRQVLVKHLICACTGLPRQDFEWLFQFAGVTPASALATLATSKPTSKFGEMFQYSNSLAGAAGFVGGHVAYPKLELGAAYDKAMQTLVFDPLGMKRKPASWPRATRATRSARSP